MRSSIIDILIRHLFDTYAMARKGILDGGQPLPRRAQRADEPRALKRFEAGDCSASTRPRDGFSVSVTREPIAGKT